MFVTATGGRMLFVSSPAGNEEFFLELGRLGPDPAPDQTSEVNGRFTTAALPGDEGRSWQPIGR
jgi:hypothetical protein